MLRTPPPSTRECPQLLKHMAINPRSAFVCHLQAWRKTGERYLLFFERFSCNLRSFLVDSQRHRAPMDARQAMNIACDLCAGVVFVHACSVNHRDLKPDNISLGRTDALWKAVIADFGNSAIVQHNQAASTACTDCSQRRP